MDARLVYWTWALLNMLLAVGCALAGVRRIRRGEVERHRRLMLGAGGFVGLFIVSYVLKVPLLGREALLSWSDGSILMLRLHETCVLAMLLGGGYAGALAFRLRGARIGSAPLEAREARRRLVHRCAGWTAVVSSILGAIFALFVLQGMYQRAGSPNFAKEGSTRPAASLGSLAAPPFELVSEGPDEG